MVRTYERVSQVQLLYMQGFTLAAVKGMEKHTLNSRLDLQSCQRQRSLKCRSRAPGHGACLKSMSKTIPMQGSILTAITVAEKLERSRIDVNFANGA